ncbi:NADH-ubiquinone oxidoreductase-F iron-sulfur binding region domain-containing protein [uncultured Sphaerochaeta sp.]|uniref:NADH-ubiquinone oxidoreductase-F iron-sulfur binding region domain-containing protein n=1 Tax=uncultured Sphaerochaeta sp. TaxID=886478 RepID=UPI002A0A35A8|nr:NADH-ubiquinone oxidoreductase-F iron-sulfur binding region domain-containing protein [uncultured Sphaerochaeta sp.]
MQSKMPADITNIRDKMRKAEAENNTVTNIYIHMGTCGIASGAVEVLNVIKKKLKEDDVKNTRIITTGCAGICSREPLITVQVPGQEPIIYQKVDSKKAEKIIQEHVENLRVVPEYAYARGREADIRERKEHQGIVVGQSVMDSSIPAIEDIPFFKLQEQRVMRNRGLIDPNKIDDYIARDGYQGAIKALTGMTSEEVIEEVLQSGIRGRGGAGFSTGLKWKFAAKEDNATKYVLCNADEGDPGAYMDRSVLESDPHSVIEGMLIAGKAIGAHQGYIYCRAEYPLAVEVLNKAIKSARRYGLLGEDILGSGFSFDIEVYEGAGAFVCGEETALMRSIEGRRGNPRPRPPFPAHAGLNEKPTILNNVETLANIPQIIVKGSIWFSRIGTKKSPGTKVFSVTGDINNVGCVEVPIGTTLRTIVEEIGGGVVEGKRYKAAQLGGPSGGCIPLQHIDVPVDYETLQEYGAIMGSGGLIVICDDKSAVDIARFFMEFCKEEACGKCIPGREGTKQMLQILDRICAKKGHSDDIQKLEELARVIQKTALCALCKTSANPVLSTLRYFRNEYEEALAIS